MAKESTIPGKLEFVENPFFYEKNISYSLEKAKILYIEELSDYYFKILNTYLEMRNILLWK